MHYSKEITLTGFLVKYVDLRELRPRTVREEVYVLDKNCMDALELLGLDVADFITACYQRGGYHVSGVESVAAKRTACLNLNQVWEFANASPQEDLNTIPNSEVCPE